MIPAQWETCQMLRVYEGDITRVQADAVVNAANPSLLGGGGVDGAIHRAAGPELLEACRPLGPCPPGEVRSTPAFRLPARWVIHAVGPVWRGGGEGEAETLEACYRNAFEEALRLGARSIAFPAISTGVYGYPKDQAARIAVKVMREYEDRFDEIIAVCFSPEDADIYRRELANQDH